MAAEAADSRERGASHYRPAEEPVSWSDLLRAYAIALAVIAVVVLVAIGIVVDIFDGDDAGSVRGVGDTCVDDFTIGADGRWYGSMHACYSTSDRYPEPPVRLSKGDRY